jgi:hypothetical protein
MSISNSSSSLTFTSAALPVSFSCNPIVAVSRAIGEILGMDDADIIAFPEIRETVFILTGIAGSGGRDLDEPHKILFRCFPQINLIPHLVDIPDLGNIIIIDLRVNDHCCTPSHVLLNFDVPVQQMTAVSRTNNEAQDDEAFVLPPHARQYTLLQFRHAGGGPKDGAVKHIKVVRETKPTTDARPDTFYIRHDRFFTLLGTVIIFITFIAKEGFSDKLKDSVSSMEAAESLSILRRDIAFGQTDGKPLPNPQPGKTPTRQESLDDIEVRKLEGQSLAEIAGYQAMSVPDSDDLVKQARTLLGRFDEIDREYRKVNVPAKPPYNETYVEGEIDQLYDDAKKDYSDPLIFEMKCS